MSKPPTKFRLTRLSEYLTFWCMDIQTLIDRAGGLPQFMARIGVARTTVLGWKQRGTIPGNRVAQISAATGLPVAEVVKLTPPPRSAARATIPSANPQEAA